MTNLQKIKDMSLDELADWLDDNVYVEDAPWMKWWDEQYCSKCESVECHFMAAQEKLGITTLLGDTIECAYCELADENGVRKCRFFQDLDHVPDHLEIIKMWLEEEAE